MGLWARIKQAMTAAGRSPDLGSAQYGLGPLALETTQYEWQYDAARMYNVVPELRYGIYWIAASASRNTLITARVPEAAGDQPIPVDASDPAAAPLLEFAPTAPEMSERLYRMTTLKKLVGRWRIVGFNTRSGKRKWMVVSEWDYRESGGAVEFHDIETGEPYQLPKSEVWSVPMWQPHPIRSSEPDAPTRALIPTLHELLDLSGHVQTAAKSRIAGAGLLLVPNSLNTVSPGAGAGPNPPDGSATMQALLRAAQASLKNPLDISRHLPVILQGNQESLNAVRHLTLATPFDERVEELRTAAVRRIAVGLDIPAEILSGLGDLNHWTAWLVEASGNRVNVEPTLAQISREMTVKFLRPALRAMVDQDPMLDIDPEDYMIWYDSAGADDTPNKSDVALAAYELGLISQDAARTTLGYGPADAPRRAEARDAAEAGDETAMPGEGPDERARTTVTESVSSKSSPSVRIRRTMTNRAGAPEGDETQVGLSRFASSGGAGWMACADVAARRALRRTGQHLLGSGSRSLRGKYKDVPLDEIHTRLRAADEQTVQHALKDAFIELEAAAPPLVPVVRDYVRSKITTGSPHSMSDLSQYMREYEF